MAELKSKKKFDPNNYPLNPGIRLIEASAGTGKTFTIAHLIIRLITEKKCPIHKILVVTFTEAAATELKSRIISRIESTLKGLESLQKNEEINLPDEVLYKWLLKYCREEKIRLNYAQSLIEALEGIDSADITTIHGFCRRSLRREPIATSSSIDLEIDIENRKQAYEIIHEYWIEELLSLDPENLKGLQETILSVDTLTDSLLRIDNDPSLKLSFENKSIKLNEPLNNQFNDWLRIYWSEFKLEWEKYGHLLEEDFKAIAEKYRSLGLKDTKPFSPKPKKNRVEILSKWIKEVDEKSININNYKTPKYIEIRSQRLIIDYFHPSKVINLTAKFEKNANLLSKPKLQESIAKLWDGPAENVWCHALAWGLRELESIRSKKGLISYGGLIKEFDSVINHSISSNGDNHLLKKLSNRYNVTFIDEFQDTDSTQWSLFKSLFRREKEHLLLMVGDPKQAIYRFRGGDLNTYIKAKKNVDRIDELTDNFRATSYLMEALNAFFKPGLNRSKLSVTSLTPSKEDKALCLDQMEKPFTIINLDEILSKSNAKSKKLENRKNIDAEIPNIIAKTILNLFEDSSREVLPSDICVIVNRHEQANKIREGLAMAGIPSKLVSQGDILTTEAAKILQRFLDCLVSPGDLQKLKIMACSPLMQWSQEQLITCEKNGQLDQLATKFEHWSRYFSSQGILGCIAELLEGKMIADLSERGRILGDLQQCSQLVEEAIHLQGLNLKQASEWLKQQRLQPTNLIPDNRQPYSDIAQSAVNVVTVHRSKGMEYEIVICPYLWQSPPANLGPLFRANKTHEWIISLNSKWGKGRFVAEDEKESSLEEAERLAYVALTRAKTQLFIIWAKSVNQQGNPLIQFLFGSKCLETEQIYLTSEKMKEWITINTPLIKIENQVPYTRNRKYLSRKNDLELSLGPYPKRSLDIHWGSNSYSGWVHKQNILISNIDPFSEELLSSERSNDELSLGKIDNNYSINKGNKWSENGPLGLFPKGAAAGDCLHKILEKIDFIEPTDNPISTEIIQQELLNSGFNLDLTENVQEGLKRVFTVPLGKLLGQLSLNQISQTNRINEMHFDLPIAHKGNPISPSDLANVFRKDPSARFSSSYIKKLEELSFNSKGFLTGSIDLVFKENEFNNTERWWIVDWKSNWIGDISKEEEESKCGPRYYNNEAMEKQMILHHYPLQAHLYLVALHRYLKWRVHNYSIKKNLGGYIYFFLRGIPSIHSIKEDLSEDFIPGIIVENAPLNRVTMLDSILRDGGQ